VSDRHRRLVASVAFAAAACLLVAGTVVWRLMSSPPPCPANAMCVLAEPAYRLHPLRAELLWAAGGLCVAAGIWASLTTLRGRRRMARTPGLTVDH
jgi:hypothetical protein